MKIELDKAFRIGITSSLIMVIYNIITSGLNVRAIGTLLVLQTIIVMLAYHLVINH